MRLTIFTVNEHCPPKPQFLDKQNYLNEFASLDEKAKVRENLGISDFVTVDTLSLLENTDAVCAYVKYDPDNIHFYVRSGDEWKPVQGGSGEVAESLKASIPIYTPDIEASLGTNLPELYITIPSESELTTSNGTYLDILFAAIRSLQSEVTKLRNAFKYGINSYTGTDTAISSQAGEATEEEPVWAIEEDSLSLIEDGLTDGEFTPIENVNSETFAITGSATYQCKFTEVTDTKILVYITSSSKNISILFTNGDIIDLSKLSHNTATSYHYIILVSRKLNNVGNNFIYITVSNGRYTLAEGYWDEGRLLVNPVYVPEALTIDTITFTNLTLSKLVTYSKYLDFSNSVIESIPSEEDYKYSAAHITIRSVKTKEILDSIANLILNDELVWVEGSRSLYIKSNDTIIAIGSVNNSGNNTSGMTEADIIELLKQIGIVQEETDGTLSISTIADLTFIHLDTGNRFKISVDSEGNLRSLKISEDGTLEDDTYVKSLLSLTGNIRGLIGSYNVLKSSKEIDKVNSYTQDAKLGADRVKIGAVYAPLNTDTVFGCSHAYVELENTSDLDYNLDGMYLHFAQKGENNKIVVKHLPLTGMLYAGSTYLIRGKQYADHNSENCYLIINTYDLEWYYNKELIDFTYNATDGIAFCLTLGLPNLQYDTKMFDASGTSCSNYNIRFVDGIAIGKAALDGSNEYWARQAYTASSNTIYKNTFELDPAKQAFQALYAKDSSRVRWKETSDLLDLTLDKEYIEFYHTDDSYPISNFTPKASFEKKNVCTDKSKLDMNKPNMVTCAFGLNMSTTRCFNWISAGLFDEYVFIKNGDSWDKFESYKTISAKKDPIEVYPHRKEFDKDINNTIYARIQGVFPADGTHFTSHKCIIDVTDGLKNLLKTYTYVVGRADKNGNPDFEHCSEEFTFTMYPTTYTPRIYQITDLQGFHWIEYQVWAAAAKKLNEEINTAIENDKIIPVLINTGDMTQNGTRINEWLDYYNAGKCLFNHLELMNVVGNNDLCGTVPTELGTGDDNGKSNSYYFHLFYCYEIDTDNIPIYVGSDNTPRYIPSLYKFGRSDFACIMVNSELTEINCRDWFKAEDNDDTINIYTGYTLKGRNYVKSSVNKYIYEILYQWFKKAKIDTPNVITACHEMPFTVITNANLTTNNKSYYRSKDNSSDNLGLVGSHLNLLTDTETGKATYWFSRLLEYFGIKLCIGGHKHTYSVTYPIRENYVGVNEVLPMTMEETLENDSVEWVDSDGTNLTKTPLTNSTEAVDGSPANDYFFPITYTATTLVNPVVYFMCQATGYKLNSNKELPSPSLRFSLLIPQTANKKPDTNLLYPMYGIIDITDTGFNIKLIRITNIKTSENVFTQNSFATSEMGLQSLTTSDTKYYGTWSDAINNLVTVS